MKARSYSLFICTCPYFSLEGYTNHFILRHTYLPFVVNMMGGSVEFKTVTIEKPADMNFILGQSHFIKTVEDISEVVSGSVPGAKFGLAFCESSGDCLVRVEGNNEELKALARDNALAIGAGHSFILFLRDCYPINVLNAIKNIQEVCTIYCATANPAEVIIAESAQGRGIMGVIDGEKPKGVEGPDGVAWRTGLLRKFGYKRG
jgi:uncharacterized protein